MAEDSCGLDRTHCRAESRLKDAMRDRYFQNRLYVLALGDVLAR